VTRVAILPAWFGRMLARGGRENRFVQPAARVRICCAGVRLTLEVFP